MGAEANTFAAKVLAAALVGTLFLLETDAAGVRTTFALYYRNREVEVGVCFLPVCAVCVDATTHPVPFLRASVIFACGRGLAAYTRILFGSDYWWISWNSTTRTIIKHAGSAFRKCRRNLLVVAVPAFTL